MALHIVECMQAPHSIGPDLQGRPRIVINVDIQRDPASGENFEVNEELLEEVKNAIVEATEPNDWQDPDTEDRIHIGLLPDDESQNSGGNADRLVQVVIFEYPGSRHMYGVGDGRPLIESGRVQVLCRGGNGSQYDATRRQAERIYRILDSLG